MTDTTKEFFLLQFVVCRNLYYDLIILYKVDINSAKFLTSICTNGRKKF